MTPQGVAGPGFVGCYRHPDRQTGISCQRCHKPICGECMNAASVGFQCPRCVTSGRASVRQPRTRFGAELSDKQPGTIGVMVATGAVWVLDLVSGGLVTGLTVMDNGAVQIGQFWRLVTGVLTSGSIFGVLMNLLVLWLVGRTMESALGTWRFLALYLVSGLGGFTLFFVLGPTGAGVIGASTAIVGLLAANAIGKLRTGEDIRPDIGLLVLLVLYAVLVGFTSFGWLSLIGGVAVGALFGAILTYAPRDNRALIQTVGLLGVVALCAAAVVLRLTVL